MGWPGCEAGSGRPRLRPEQPRQEVDWLGTPPELLRLLLPVSVLLWEYASAEPSHPLYERGQGGC